ncbi:hypothetical protein BDD12DRAFT_18993 [Trichophaea hybrida]|nr:hypothetical protein BDD12DRAFT_18993 [Trichophaea hybrida]
MKRTYGSLKDSSTQSIPPTIVGPGGFKTFSASNLPPPSVTPSHPSIPSNLPNHSPHIPPLHILLTHPSLPPKIHLHHRHRRRSNNLRSTPHNLHHNRSNPLNPLGIHRSLVTLLVKCHRLESEFLEYVPAVDPRVVDSTHVVSPSLPIDRGEVGDGVGDVFGVSGEDGAGDPEVGAGNGFDKDCF